MTDWYKIKRVLVWQNWQEKQIYPAGWKPWSNTIAYYKFNGNWNDSSWNWLNLTMNNVTYSTLSSWISVAYFNGSAYWLNTSLSKTLTEWTQSIWICKSRNTDSETFTQIGSVSPTDWEWSIKTYWTSTGNIWTTLYYWGFIYRWYNNTWISNWTWIHVVVVWWSGGNKLYVNWQQVTLSYVYWNSSTSFGSRAFTILSIGRHRAASADWMQWYVSEWIVEDKQRTAQEVIDYYNQTKSNYWL